jgi:hypothetical protein
MVDLTGFEPVLLGYQPNVLPLHYRPRFTMYFKDTEKPFLAKELL